MRRTGGLLVAAALFAVVACGGGDDDAGGSGGGGGDTDALPDCPLDALEQADGPVEVTYWHGMQEQSEATLQQLTDQFNNEQDQVRVELVNNPSGQHEKFVAGLSTGELPDILQHDSTYLREMIDTRAILPVQSCIDASDTDMSDFVERTTSYFQVDGVQWAMPFGIANPVLIYDRAAFREAGLDPDEPPATLEEWRDAAQAIKDSGRPYGLAMAVEAWHFEEMVALRGGTYVDEGNGRDGQAAAVTFDGDAGQELFTFLDELVADGLAKTNPRRGPSSLDNLFAVGNHDAAMTITSSSNLGSILQVLSSGQYGGVELGIAPLPGSTDDGGVVVGGGGLFISAKDPDKQAAAWEFVEFLSTPESQSIWAAGTGYVPTRQSAVDLPEITQRWNEIPGFRIAYDQLLQGAENDATAGALVGHMNEIRLAVEDAMTAMYLDEMTAEEALAKAAEDADDVIATYNEGVG